MRFEFERMTGTLLRRYKRFFVDVQLESGETVTAHCPNTGRMEGCAVPGSPVLLSRSTNPNRRLACTLELVCVDGRWRSVNTMRANLLVQEAVEQGRLAELADWRFERREAVWGSSRFDLLLHRADGGSQRCFIEVKNVTLFSDGVAYFPDAVTERGAKHLETLAQVARSGDRAVQLYVVNDPTAIALRPAAHIDPHYAATLRRVVGEGVEALAYTWSATTDGMEVAGTIPVDLA